MTRIFKPSWSNAPQEAPISVGQEHRAGTRALRLPKGPASDEALTEDSDSLANERAEAAFTSDQLPAAKPAITALTPAIATSAPA